MRKPKLIISKCLNSEKCRYNGQAYDDKVISLLRKYVDLETVCPETEIGLNKFNNKKGMVFSTEPCPFYMLPSSLSSLRTNIKLSIKQLFPTSKIGT